MPEIPNFVHRILRKKMVGFALAIMPREAEQGDKVTEEERFAGQKIESNTHKFVKIKDGKGVEVEIPIDLPSLG